MLKTLIDNELETCGVRTLAAKLGTSHGTISKVKNGGMRPNLDLYRAAAEYFEVDLNELITRTEAETHPDPKIRAKWQESARFFGMAMALGVASLLIFAPRTTSAKTISVDKNIHCAFLRWLRRSALVGLRLAGAALPIIPVRS